MNRDLSAPARVIRSLAFAAPLLCLALAGCHVSSHGNGKNDNVDIGTPFGSMHVKTNDTTSTAAIGLAPYPGAVPLKDGDQDGNSADVNMSFGSFHLGVQAASFQTADSPDKVLAFYRKDLARYGEVIECRDNAPVGQPTHTVLGLTCNDQGHHHSIVIQDSDLELRAGSPEHQHIVSTDAKDGGTKIGLVALDLPSGLNQHGKGDVE
jgi:hypothetical protein